MAQKAEMDNREIKWISEQDQVDVSLCALFTSNCLDNKLHKV